MYVSDFGYGANPEKWTTGLYYNYGTDNWMYMGLMEWTISRNASNWGLAFDVWTYAGGYVHYDGASGVIAVRPSFILASTVEFSGGNGTLSDPFTLSVN